MTIRDRLRVLARPTGAPRPAAVVVGAFAGLVLLGTVLLALPIARSGPGGAPALTAFFTSVSAVSVTGLATVDTGTYWSGFGQAVVLALVQLGGLGISTGAALLAIVVTRRLGLRTRLYTATETGSLALGDVRRVVLGVAAVSLACEAVVTVVLALRFWAAYGESPLDAAWLGLFHAVTAFNNAGFALFSDSLMGFAADPWILLPVSAAVIVGGIGVPVLYELARERPLRLSLHSRVTLWLSGALLCYGMVAIAWTEWTNPATLGPQPTPEKLLNAWFQSVSPRTAGFNSLDYEQMRPESLFVTNTLMFVGGGSASTAGGIRVTTLAVLFLVLWAQARGQRDAVVRGRRLPESLVQQALVITMVFALLSVLGTIVLIPLSGADADRALFEVISALGTVGLSAGLTPDLGPAAQVFVALLMFIGRVGPTTLATALALRQREQRYRYPEGRVLVG